MRIIPKKIWTEYFELVATGKKRFELRLADFDMAEGDTLILEEWDPKTKEYTGRTMEVTVTMVCKTKDQKFWSAADVKKYGFQILQIELPPPRPSDTSPQAGGEFPRGVETVVGVVIRNEKGGILLTRSKKWSRLVIPGGHVEPGETILEAAKREGEEETGLRLKPVAVLRWGEQISPPEFHRPAHWIFFHCLCDVVGGDVRLQESELTSYSWMKPDEVMKEGMYQHTIRAYYDFINNRHSVLKLGEYEHYKGGRYEVIGVATHSESGEQLVTYRALDKSQKLWVRPLAMFTETVELRGKRVPRFRRISDRHEDVTS